MSEPALSVTTYVSTAEGDDVLIANAEVIPGKREYVKGAIEFEVTYRASFCARLTDDVDFLWPFLGAALARFDSSGSAKQPTSFGEKFDLTRDARSGRATLLVTDADGTSHRVSLPERQVLVVLADEARHVAEHLVRLTGSDGGLASSAAAIEPT